MASNEMQTPGTAEVFVAGRTLERTAQEVRGGFTDLHGEKFYRIENYDRLRPFFMTVVSDSDHWLFLSSKGSLTCGRRSSANALFPYTTDDKIHDAAGQVGPVSLLLVESGNGETIWEPFSDRYEGAYQIERNLSKNIPGNKLVFEEVNRTLGIAFRYAWMVSDRFGFVRHVEVGNLSDRSQRLRVVDGLLNVLPANVDPGMQNSFSTLVDAYRISERLPGSGVGIFTLSSVPVDRAEPSESLLANTVATVGLDEPTVILDADQLGPIRRGQNPTHDDRIRGVRGCYMVHKAMELDAGSQKDWFLIADVNQDAASVADLDHRVRNAPGFRDELLADIEKGTDQLVRIVESADGIQSGGDPIHSARHFSNTLFNVMRGGVIDDDYQISTADLDRFLRNANRPATARLDLTSLGEKFTHEEGLRWFKRTGDPDLERLYYEYLPLTFSRRHGDPSRPWNAFSIETRNADGSRKLSYQGNWRDIFQNWEALGTSYPEFFESMICKFVNASTADGHNPYRISRDGIDWEIQDPDDPWSFIGYWGDHQIIYLVKLLEHSRSYHPGRLQELLGREIFTYADVPYRIKPYESLLANPSETIDFDDAANEATVKRVSKIGSDGKLLHDGQDELVRVNLTEKLLVPLLAKLSSFIADGGIWMNTQRPEWNDANNALVGHGISMVTLCYIRRHLDFLIRLFGQVSEADYRISTPVVDHLEDIHAAFAAHRDRYLSGEFGSEDRRLLLDKLGAAGCRYRSKVYREFDRATSRLDVQKLVSFLKLSREFVDRSIENNRREDGLYHAYNLLRVDSNGGVSIDRLDLMLEGQVAVLSCGKLDVDGCLELLHGLRASPLFRSDQNSYLLYPDRDLPRFMEKGCVSDASLFEAFPQVFVKDQYGTVRFKPSLRNAGELQCLMERLALSMEDRSRLLQVYEQTFEHRSFTGRSGTFFKYEGLGCIYWHMVSKLLLAVAERCIRAKADGDAPDSVDALLVCYRDIQRGIGAHKSVAEQGGFPTDPYSHTPSMLGSQQPGLTGQVKEDFMVRMIELGVRVEDGCLSFDPFLLSQSEYQNGPIRFSLCQVPITLQRDRVPRVRVIRPAGERTEIPGLTLDSSLSRELFERRGSIERLEVFVAP